MTDSTPDPLVHALLPVLLHKLGNATQLLTGLNAMLAFDDGASLVAGRAADLARAGETIERMGWLLGVLGSAAGDELLLARRAPAGLAWMIELLQDGCRRDGTQLAGPNALPGLAPSALDGWQLPWGVARLLFAARRDQCDTEPMTWQLSCSERGYCLEMVGGNLLAADAEVVLPHLPGAQASLAEDGRFRLDMPAVWFQEEPCLDS